MRCDVVDSGVVCVGRAGATRRAAQTDANALHRQYAYSILESMNRNRTDFVDVDVVVAAYRQAHIVHVTEKEDEGTCLCLFLTFLLKNFKYFVSARAAMLLRGRTVSFARE